MKLLKLYISGYKNLKDVKIDFSNTNVTALIGNNGSGKSNVLESISAIFAGLYRERTPKLPFNAKLQYKKSDKKVAFIEAPGYVKMTLDRCDVDYDDYIEKAEDFLPKKIITVYSGEEKRLWDEYYKEQYLKYCDLVINGKDSSLKMQYINKYYWEICLLTLLLFNKNALKDFKFCSVSKMRFNFNKGNVETFRENPVTGYVSELMKAVDRDNCISLDDYERFNSDRETDSNVFFEHMAIAILPKNDKLINSIEFLNEKNINVLRGLSEGEKKQLILNAVYEVLVDGETLVLLDEPDAHVHDGKKKEIYDIINKYANSGICTVLTSHSPTMIDLFDEEQIKMLNNGQNGVEIVETDKLKMVRTLTEGKWSYMDAGIFLQSDSPILLVEGQDDVNYIRKAIEIFSKLDEKYKELKFDIISFNGTGNAKCFVENLKGFFADRNIICVFDRDDAGKEGMAGILSVNKDSIIFDDQYRQSEDSKIITFFYPPAFDKPIGSNFLLEDYFPDEYIKPFVDSWVEENFATRYKSQPKLDKAIKDHIIKDFADKKIDDKYFEGFKILCDKLLDVKNSFTG